MKTINRKSLGAPPASIRSANVRKNLSLRNKVAIVGTAAATVVFFEVLLIPALIAGAIAVAPALDRRPKSDHRLYRFPRSRKPIIASASLLALKPTYAVHTTNTERSKIKQAALKTVSFRLVASSVDFTINYLFIGELAAAAGLSAFALVALPILYFAHETLWNRYSATARHKAGRWGDSIELPFNRPIVLDRDRSQEIRPVTVNLAVTKALTYRVAATSLDFTANYVVVRNLGSAATLSLIGLIIGPFIYYGHEVAWARLSKTIEHDAEDDSEPNVSVPLLPAPSLV